MLMDVSPEQVAAWGEELAELTEGLGHLFARPEPGEVFADLVEGLLDDLPRKNGWTLAARAGHASPDRIQKFLAEASWNEAALRAAVRDYIVVRLGDEAAVLVLDDTQAIKKGTKSVGVAHQHCGTTGDVRNCQVMVMLTYAAPTAHTFLDRRLYLPESWAFDATRRAEAKVPPSVAFATKPALVISMLADALAAQVPFSFVAADSGYGRDPHLRAFLHQQAIRYVVGVPVDLPITSVAGKPGLGAPQVARAGHLLHYAVSRNRWERRSCGEGAKGQRYYDWTVVEVTVTGQAPADGFAHRLLIRRSTEKKQLTGGRFDFEYAYFLAHAPTITPVPVLIRIAGVRWQTEEDNRETKQLVGLEDYQVRKWTPWHRYTACCLLAHAFLAVQRAEHPDPADATDAGTPSDAPGKAPAAGEGRPDTSCRSSA